MSLAERLRELRAAKKVSLQVVADAVGISKPHVWELEKGKTKNPSLELLKQFSDYYDVSLDDLAGSNEQTPVGKRYLALFRKIDPDNKSVEELEMIEQAIDVALHLIENKQKGRG
jgi:Predicted transcriptional regulators